MARDTHARSLTAASRFVTGKKREEHHGDGNAEKKNRQIGQILLLH
jgi:hypothetical protein